MLRTILFAAFCLLASGSFAASPEAFRVDFVDGQVDRVLSIGGDEVDTMFIESLERPDPNSVSITVFAEPVDNGFRGSTLTSEGRLGYVKWKHDGSLDQISFLKNRLEKVGEPNEVTHFSDLFSNLHNEGARGVRVDFKDSEAVRAQVIGIDRVLETSQLELLVAGIEFPDRTDSVSIFFLPPSMVGPKRSCFIGVALVENQARQIEWSLSNGLIVDNREFALEGIENDAEMNVMLKTQTHPLLRLRLATPLPTGLFVTLAVVGVVVLLVVAFFGAAIWRNERDAAKKAADEELLRHTLVRTPAPRADMN